MKPLGKILLYNLIICLGIGIVFFVATGLVPKSQDLAIFLLLAGVALIALQGLVCWIVAIIMFVQKKAERGAGFLLSGIMVFVIGFGTCSSMLLFLN